MLKSPNIIRFILITKNHDQDYHCDHCEHENPKYTITDDYTYKGSSMLEAIKELSPEFLEIMEISSNFIDKSEEFISSLSVSEKEFVLLLLKE